MQGYDTSLQTTSIPGHTGRNLAGETLRSRHTVQPTSHLRTNTSQTGPPPLPGHGQVRGHVTDGFVREGRQ